MSVVLATPGSFASIAMTLNCLARQTVADSLELVLVVPEAAGRGELPTVLDAFHSHRVLEIGPFERVGTGNAAGATAAAAELVVFAEDHSFPEAGWAEALIDRHHEPWAAVGAVLRNANPGRISWADFLVAFGPCVEAVTGGEVDVLPGHNTSYKRAMLPAPGEGLEDACNDEWSLHQQLVASGERLYLDQRAVSHHINFGVARSWVKNCFWCGWARASERSVRWPAYRRALYALAWPLIAAIRLPPVARNAARVHTSVQLPAGVAPLLMVGLILEAFGQGAGYVTGAHPLVARGERRREFDRAAHITAADRQALGLEDA
jgi:hypothetical protein